MSLGDGLGMVVRSDQGGLGNQTYELWRRLRPAETFVVNLGPQQARGTSFYQKYCADWTNTEATPTDVISDGKLRRWMSHSDRLLTVENLYSGNRGFESARAWGITTILIANPELFAGWTADRVAVPTAWELGRMPAGTTVVPHPQERMQLRSRTEVRRFVHHWAPAMADRNGTQVLMDALPHVRQGCEVHVHAPGRPSPLRTDRVGQCRVTWCSEFLPSPWDGPGGQADCLVLPRRYGGQCLPAMEAAARSMLLLMSDLAPQCYWPISPIPAWDRHYHGMKGGQFPVYDFDPRVLADRMDRLISRGSTETQDQALRTWRWIGQWSWTSVRDRWETLCK